MPSFRTCGGTRPLVYYHDPALPYWRTIDFDYGEIGFGEICEDPDTLVETLCAYMERDCELDDFYRGRIERFFVQTDREASRRVYEATRAITG